MTEHRNEDEEVTATPAVIYGAKSTEDKHGSIPTQLADCRKLAEGWEVVGEYSDEAATGWRGDRGPELARALDHAERIAPCVLCVQHSDRLARGDGRQARHLVEIMLWAIKADVTIRSVQDDLFADERVGLLMGALMGQRNTEDSARKSAATKAGLKRREQEGKPVGPIPLGYVPRTKLDADGQPVLDKRGNVVTERVIDLATRPTVERIFDLIESGATPGDVSRLLNREGITTRRGGTWVPRTVRKVVHNRSYLGERGYDRIVDPDQWAATHERLRRLDPVQVAKRQGGRKPRDESYFLRGIAFCGSCGAPMYTRLQRDKRMYVCRNRRQGTGLCSAPPIPAELIESHVLRHLDSFVGSIEDWLAERVNERQNERQAGEVALQRQRAQLVNLDRARKRHLAEYRKLVAEGASVARLALEEVERIDRLRAEQEQAIQQAEAVVSEWTGPPDVDAALEYYSALVDLVQGRIRATESSRELTDALSTVVAGLWAEIEEDRKRLLVEFELVEPVEHRLPGGVPILPEFQHRPTLPPRHLGDRVEPEPLRQIGTQTLVCVQPQARPISA